tara:strand:+ start:110 stop:289 length:180 start_codon:yes stop_codon:yes gene_type:complete
VKKRKDVTVTFDVNQLEQLDKINIFGNRSRLLQLIVESFLNQELTVADLIKKRREAVQT